jgi:hypothetical protein
MDYEEEFTAANARRQLFGKKPLPFHKNQKWFLDPNTLNGMVYAIRSETEKYNCRRDGRELCLCEHASWSSDW